MDGEEDLVDSKFEKMDDQDDIHIAYEKLYKVSKKYDKLIQLISCIRCIRWLATKKLSDLELDREELSTKFDEANQTIGALRFENNFLTKWTKKLEAELVSILLCSSWRSSQSPHVPFELEWFQFFPPHRQFKGLLSGKDIPRCGRKKGPSDSITSSLFLPFPFLFLHYLCVLLYYFESI